MKTPDEIKKGMEDVMNALEEYFLCRHDLTFETYQKGMSAIPNALALIQQLEADNERLKYTLAGVMHFVDKWVNISPYDVEMDHHGEVAVNRAAFARKIALEAIELLEAERDAAVKDIYEMAKCIPEDVCEWCDQTECERLCMMHATEKPGFKWRGVQKEELTDV